MTSIDTLPFLFQVTYGERRDFNRRHFRDHNFLMNRQLPLGLSSLRTRAFSAFLDLYQAAAKRTNAVIFSVSMMKGLNNLQTAPARRMSFLITKQGMESKGHGY
jgi:hypothetical protein